MNASKINEILNSYAPLELSNRFVEMTGGYDNSGIILNTGAKIKGVVFSLDLTNKAVEYAIEKDCNLIITHHPAIFKGGCFSDKNSPIFTAIEKGINVISYHLNLDVAKRGIDYYLANGLGASEQVIVYDLQGGQGYGRKYKSQGEKFLQIVKLYEQTFNSKRIITYGNLNEKVNKIASFCGSGLSENEISLASDCDLLISSDAPHHVILKAGSVGKKLMLVTHYSAEFYGFSKFYEHFSNKLSVKTFLLKEDAYL